MNSDSPEVTVLMASAIVMDEGMLPCRIVLCERLGRVIPEWVAWMEIFYFDEVGRYSSQFFAEGDYCSDLHEAMKRFHDRASRLLFSPRSSSKILRWPSFLVYHPWIEKEYRKFLEDLQQQRKESGGETQD